MLLFSRGCNFQLVEKIIASTTDIRRVIILQSSVTQNLEKIITPRQGQPSVIISANQVPGETACLPLTRNALKDIIIYMRLKADRPADIYSEASPVGTLRRARGYHHGAITGKAASEKSRQSARAGSGPPADKKTKAKQKEGKCNGRKNVQRNWMCT